MAMYQVWRWVWRTSPSERCSGRKACGAPVGSDVKREPKTPALPKDERGVSQLVQGEIVELTGFEPVTPSLRKMWSRPSDQAKQYAFTGLWGSCGASDVRHSEIS